MINMKLAAERGISEDSIQRIVELHEMRETVTDYGEWMGINRTLQALWGFKPCDTFIKFWQGPGCSCPWRDNEERYPSISYIIDGRCKIHSP